MSITDNLDKDQTAILEILGAFNKEYLRARTNLQHEPMHSAHEGYAILLEEVDELWDLIKLKNPSKEEMYKEAVQIGAMTLAFILEICNKK